MSDTTFKIGTAITAHWNGGRHNMARQETYQLCRVSKNGFNLIAADGNCFKKKPVKTTNFKILPTGEVTFTADQMNQLFKGHLNYQWKIEENVQVWPVVNA